MKNSFTAKKFLYLALALLTAINLISCSSKNYSTNNYLAESQYSDADYAPSESETAYDYASQDMKFDTSGTLENSSNGLNSSEITKSKSERKVIYSSEINIETKNYDKSIQELNSLVEKHNAYIENSDVNNSGYTNYRTRRATYVIRIPKDNYAMFISDSGNIGVITRCMDKNTDVTEKYIDTEARIETLEIMEQRLLLLLEKSESIEDIITLEQKLSETRYEIENLTGSLRKYDSLIAYSTATINIYEVEQITKLQELPKSFGEKIANSFKDSMQNIKSILSNTVIWLVYALPLITVIALPLIILAFVVIFIRKAYKKKKHKSPSDQNNND